MASRQALWQIGLTEEVKPVVLTQTGPVWHWHILGPFDNKDDKGFDTVYPPEREINLNQSYIVADGSTIQWKKVLSNDKDARWFPLDFNALIEGGPYENVVAYAVTSIWSDRDRDDAIFWLASDDGVKVWVNGVLVHNHHVHRGLGGYGDRFEVHLKQGENIVLGKVTQREGDWGLGLYVDPGAQHREMSIIESGGPVFFPVSIFSPEKENFESFKSDRDNALRQAQKRERIRLLEDFNSEKLSEGWEWQSTLSNWKYSLTEMPGKLFIATDGASDGDIRLWQNVIDDFTIQVELQAHPTRDGDAAGIVFESDEGTLLRLKKASTTHPQGGVILQLVQRAGQAASPIASVVAPEGTVSLRLRRNGGLFSVFYNTDGGKHWQLLGQVVLELSHEGKVGLHLSGAPHEGGFQAIFDNLALREVPILYFWYVGQPLAIRTP